jgi:hypothetical protein
MEKEERERQKQEADEKNIMEEEFKQPWGTQPRL